MGEEKKKKGFAAMSREKQREIASKGGKASQASGKGHRFTTEEAIAAGHKGGMAVSRNREHMSEIGKMGGAARAEQTKGGFEDE